MNEMTWRVGTSIRTFKRAHQGSVEGMLVYISVYLEQQRRTFVKTTTQVVFLLEPCVLRIRALFLRSIEKRNPERVLLKQTII
jgi:hypothetical protein